MENLKKAKAKFEKETEEESDLLERCIQSLSILQVQTKKIFHEHLEAFRKVPFVTIVILREYL